MIILDNQRQIRSSPCSCGQSFVQGTSCLTTNSVALVCPSCRFTYPVSISTAEGMVGGSGTIWDAIIAVRGPSRSWPQRGWQPAQVPPTPQAYSHRADWEAVVRNMYSPPTPPPAYTPPPRPSTFTPPRPRTEQPFGVRHNLPPPKPPEPLSPEPIKEIPREYDRYELLELDKNTVQKELTFEGDWFMYIELN